MEGLNSCIEPRNHEACYLYTHNNLLLISTSAHFVCFVFPPEGIEILFFVIHVGPDNPVASDLNSTCDLYYLRHIPAIGQLCQQCISELSPDHDGLTISPELLHF
jgi:hypothetical protein